MKREVLSDIDAPAVHVVANTTARTAHVAVPPVGVSLAVLERAVIRFALERHGGNQTRAARFLHLSRSALLYRMQKYHLAAPHAGSSEEGHLR